MLEGVNVLGKFVYKSLSESQIEREVEITANPISKPELDVEQTPAEILYQEHKISSWKSLAEKELSNSSLKPIRFKGSFRRDKHKNRQNICNIYVLLL